MVKKIAIVGVGSWGVNHVKTCAILRAEGLIEDIIIMDARENRAKYVATIYGTDWTTSYDNILNDDEIDGVIIASPTKLHYEQTKKALIAGKHVLVEKPMAENSSQARELVDLAHNEKRILMTGFLLRCSPAVGYVKELYMRNKEFFGDVLLMYSKRVTPYPSRELDVGVIKDLAIHDIDLATYIFNAKPRRVFGVGRKILASYETISVIISEYELNDATFNVIIEASWIAPYKFRRFEITTTKTVISLDLIFHSVEIFANDGIMKPKLTLKEPLYELDKNFILSIDGKKKPIVTGEDGYRALLVCDKIIESITKNSVVEIPE